MREVDELHNKYVVVIFTNFNESVGRGQSLWKLLPSLQNSECFVITRQATFAALKSLESTDRESVAVIVHQETLPSKSVKDFIQKTTETRTVLAGIHSGTPESVKEQQRQWITEAGGIVREYIHEINERRSPIWYSFSNLCRAVHEGKTDQFQENYAKLVWALISLPTVLAIFRHRIAHLFTPIDIDLQGLIASNFRPDYWEKVVEAYRSKNLRASIEKDANRIKDELREVANDEQKKKIDDTWRQLGLKKIVPLLSALEKGNLDRCKQEAAKFRKWFSGFLSKLDRLDEALSKEAK